MHVWASADKWVAAVQWVTGDKRTVVDKRATGAFKVAGSAVWQTRRCSLVKLEHFERSSEPKVKCRFPA